MMYNKVRDLVGNIREEINNYGRDNVVPMLRELEELTEAYGYLDDIIDTDLLDELVQSRLSDGGWQGVACMLSDVSYLNDDYYVVDGYGNIRHLQTSDLEIALDGMVSEIDLDEYDEDDEEDIE